MVRNLNILKVRPLRVALSCLKNTGPLSPAFMAMAAIRKIGEVIIRARADTPMSMSRLIIRCSKLMALSSQTRKEVSSNMD